MVGLRVLLQVQQTLESFAQFQSSLCVTPIQIIMIKTSAIGEIINAAIQRKAKSRCTSSFVMHPPYISQARESSSSVAP